LHSATDETSFGIQLAVIRAMQGAGEGFVNAGIISILNVFFDGDKYSFYIYVNNFVVGLSIALGPLIGELLCS